MKYRSYKEGDPVKINNNDTTISYVSKVVNNKKTGEQVFIITDGDPKVQKPSEVKRDWWDNNKEILSNVKKSYKRSNTIFDPTNKLQVCYSLLMEKNFEVS